MSITLDDEQTQRIFLTLVESLEDGERLPTKLLARIVHTRFLLRSLGEFEGSGCHLRGKLWAHSGL